MADTATTSDPLALQQCPNCDYALTGLPTEGTCPECGRAYDRRFIVLFGDARGKLSGLHNAGGRALVMQAIWVAVLIMVFFYGFSGRMRYTGAVIFIPLMLYPLLVRFLNPRDARIMVVIDERGVAQVDTLDPAGLLHRSMQWLAWLLMIGWVIFMIADFRGFAGSLIGAAVGMAIGLFIRLAASRERKRRQLDIAGPGGRAIKLSRWAFIDSVDIQPVNDTRHRIRVVGTKLSYVGKWHVVDAEVDLDATMASRIRGRLRIWWAAGKRGDIIQSSKEGTHA